MNVGELIEELKKYPLDKDVKIEGYWSINETDTPEEIHAVGYMDEIDYDTFEVIGKLTDYVAIITDEYNRIASEF